MDYLEKAQITFEETHFKYKLPKDYKSIVSDSKNNDDDDRDYTSILSWIDENNIDIFKRDFDHKTALHVATVNQDLKVLQFCYNLFIIVINIEINFKQ